MIGIGNRQSAIGSPRAAFTLMEILLAIGILAIGITSVLFLFAMGVGGECRTVAGRAGHRTRAALLVEAVVNQIRADLAETLPDRYVEDSDHNIDPITRAAHADFPEFIYDVAFEKLYPSDPRGDFYKIRVVIRWGNPDVERDERNSETYETILRRKNF